MHLTLFGRRAGQPSCATSQSSSTSSKSSKVLAVREKRAATLTPISSRSSALDWSITLAELAGDVSNMLQSTPAAAAAALLTAVLKTIAAVKVNQEQCLRIGERAARALAALGVQMEGKWDTAPQSLLDNLYALESTLSGLQDSMRRLSQANWRKRLLSKSQIEDTLQQCELRLDEALQCFQFTSLIQIHYAVGSRQDRCVSNGDLTVAMSSDVPEPAPSTTTAGGLEEFLATLREPEDDFGFRRYHPSEVVLSKPNPWRSGWFSELSDAQALGSKAVVKGYTGTREEALKHWYQDVKRLRNIYHPRFPQLLGYSNGKAPTPFIILSSAPKQDVVSYLQAWWTPQLSLTDSTLALLRAYRDISGAVLYAQQQLSLDNQGMKEFIRNATYAVDHNQSLILGLPVQIDDNFVQQRWTKVVGDAYLPRTIFYHYLTFLERASASVTTKLIIRESIVECIALIGEIIAFSSPDVRLHEELERALDHGDILSLPRLRTIAYAEEGRRVYQSFTDFAPLAYNDFALGDIGTGSFRDGVFIKAGNIFELEPDAHSSLTVEIDDDVLQRWPGSDNPASDAWITVGELQFMLDSLGDNEKAPIHNNYLSPVNNAWKYFLKWAKPLAQLLGVHPSELKMVINLGGPQPTIEPSADGSDTPPPVVLIPLFQAGFLRLERDDFVE